MVSLENFILYFHVCAPGGLDYSVIVIDIYSNYCGFKIYSISVLTILGENNFNLFVVFVVVLDT